MRDRINPPFFSPKVSSIIALYKEEMQHSLNLNPLETSIGFASA